MQQQPTTIDKQPFAVDLKMVYGAVAVIAYIVYTGTTRLNNIEAEIKTQKDAVAAVAAIKQDQVKTTSDVRELQTAVSNISAGQKDMNSKIDGISNDVRALGQSVGAISQALRAEPRR